MENFEQAILRFFIELHSPLLDKIMIFITNLGENGEIWIALGLILLIVKKTRKAGITVLLSLIIMLLFGDLFLKNMIARTRPYYTMEVGIIIPDPKSYSFPSGHTASSFAVAFALFKYYKKYAVVYFSAASLMAITRLYLTVHYPTDILGGIIVGFLCAEVGYLILNKIYSKFEKTHHKLNKAA